MKIGYIGLGNMGKGMVLNLLKNKHDVFVWSRTSEKVLEMEKKGAIGCSSPNEVSSKADFVMACLVDEEASTSVFLEDYDQLYFLAYLGYLICAACFVRAL